ncbi:hypothetical protein WMY93_013044 [Mugilogobius chulae]|uniref:Gypsy retrotransposon integrase-like protein 1 n=1 Tax=Mugilogobius chulae TaxID=88201 RepID=A0AAW0P0J0_9GOBI
MAEGCMMALRYGMVFFNLLFWLGGCGILGVGVWLSVTQGSFATLSSSLPSLSAANLLIAVGTVIMVIGCLGCVGAVKESRPLLLAFFIVLLLIFFLEILSIMLFFIYQDEVEGAAGQSVPYLGYIELTITFPKDFIGDDIDVCTLALERESASYQPTRHGYRAVLQLLQLRHQQTQEGSEGVVRLADKSPVTIPAGHTLVLEGSVHVKSPAGTCALVEQPTTMPMPGGLCVKSCLVTLPRHSPHKIPIVVTNESEHSVILQPLSVIAELSMSPQILSHNVVNDALPEDVNLNFDFGDSPVPPDWKERIISKLKRIPEVFSHHDLDFGCTDRVKHHIRLSDETAFKHRARPIHPRDLEAVRSHLRDLLEAGVIRESESPFSSPIVVVRKKNGDVRLCIDYRKLNLQTVKDAYALPNLEESFSALSGSRWFSVLDLKMPQGVTNAPSTFQRLMEKCMGDLHLKEVLVFLDDLIIFSDTLEEHEHRLLRVLHRLRDYGLKLSPEKCKFLQTSVRYLGHVVSEQGVETDPEKISALKSWPVPRTLKELKSFLGFAGYYRRFINSYAAIAKPLNDLTKGYAPTRRQSRKESLSTPSHDAKQPFNERWSAQCQSAFETLIDKLTTAPVLGFANPKQPYILHTDASTTGVGAALYQEQEGKLRVIAYASRGLSTSESRYPAHKLEFLALKWSVCEKFHDYLYGSTFVVVTDNNPLTYILTSAKLDAASHRWLAALSTYDFKLQYRAGSQNRDADALSRRPHHESSDAHSLKEWDMVEQFTNSHVVAPEKQRADSILREVIHQLETGENVPPTVRKELPDLALLLREFSRLEIQDDILYRRRQDGDHVSLQLVLPTDLRAVVLTSLHDDMGHMGVERTLDLVRSRFYWPRMAADVETKIKTCNRCIRRKALPERAAPLVNIKTSRPLELLCMDYLSLEPDKSNTKDILVLTDHFTKYAVAIPTANQKAKTVAKCLWENFITHYGIPERLHTDQGPDFESHLIRELCDIAGIQKTRTTPYHPRGNPVERFNRTLLSMLGTLEPEQKQRWKDYVKPLVHAYNCTRNEVTGYTPYELMFGRCPRLPVDLAFGLPARDTPSTSHSQYVQNLRSRLEESYRLASRNAAKSAERNKTRFDQRVKPSVLEEGDRVLVRNVKLRGKHKLEDKWERDIYVVLKRAGDLPVYTVQPENDTSGRTRTLHRDLLLPCGFLPEPKDRELPTLTPARRPHTRSQPKPVEDVECLSNKEEEDFAVPLVALPPVKFHIEHTLPAKSSAGTTVVPEILRLPENNLPDPGESSVVSNDVDLSSSSEGGDAVSGEPVEEAEIHPEEHLPDSPVLPETRPPEEDPVFGGPAETSPSAATSALDFTEAPPSISVSEGRDAEETEPEQFIRRSARDRQPPKRFQYSALGKPLISAVQTLLHSLADAYGEAFSTPVSDRVYIPMSM